MEIQYCCRKWNLQDAKTLRKNNRTPIFRIFFLFVSTAGDSLGYHRGMSFSTKDRDNDKSSGNCALSYKGAWWCNNCHHSNLNVLYLNGKNDPKGMDWQHWKKAHYSVKKSEMKIRPKDFWDISGTLYLCQVKSLSPTIDI